MIIIRHGVLDFPGVILTAVSGLHTDTHTIMIIIPPGTDLLIGAGILHGTDTVHTGMGIVMDTGMVITVVITILIQATDIIMIVITGAGMFIMDPDVQWQAIPIADQEVML